MTKNFEELDLLDQLDQQWRESRCANLPDLVETARQQENWEDCIELCIADLEWRWKTGSSHRNSSFETRVGSKANALEIVTSTQSARTFRLPAQPTANDYAPFLSGLWQDVTYRKRLLEAEFYARSSWSQNPPDVDLFADRLPELVDWQSDLQCTLDQISRLTMTVTHHDSVIIHTYMPSKLVVGRQKRGEPDAPAWIAEHRRLILAAFDERRMSREQLSLRRISLQELEVRNISSNVSITVDSRRISPQDCHRVSIPVVFQTETTTVRIEASSEMNP